MSVLHRILALFRAQAHSTIDRLEDPVIMADEYVRQLEAQQAKARETVAEQAGNLGLIERRWQRSQEEAAAWQRKAEAAVRAGDDNQALLALEWRRTLLATAEEYRLQYEAQSQHLAQMREQLLRLDEQLRQARIQRDLIKVKAGRSRSRQVLHGSNQQPLMEGLDRAEARLDERIAYAQAQADLQQRSAEMRLAALEPGVTIEEELAALKQRIARE
ncbi:MAG: phage shock protein A [Herpetosiphonaceae bacterium]|nr:MAG: phage shock protein A [Herpetosiphonaceae bacterium]